MKCRSPHSATTHPTVLWPVVCAAAVFLAGCHKPPPSEKYVPSAQVAQQAVEAMLKAWQAGQPPGLVPDSQPQVHLTDAHRKPGQKLIKYQVLGEVPGDAGRCIAVKATFTNPAAEEKIRFIVIGIEPLWVFRHEDFQLLMHWDHKMDPVEEQKKKLEGKSEPAKEKAEPKTERSDE